MKKIYALLTALFLMLTAYTAIAEVDQKQGNALDDAMITSAVKASLLKNQLVNDEDYSTWDIHVESVSGVVMLTGHVKTDQEKQRAQQIAKNIEGVKGVKNDLKIQPE